MGEGFKIAYNGEFWVMTMENPKKEKILLKAENDIGNVRKAKRTQIKRHISQMSERGLKILIDKFSKLDISKTTIDEKHLSKKCRQRNVSFKKQDIYDLLYRASLGGGGKDCKYDCGV